MVPSNRVAIACQGGGSHVEKVNELLSKRLLNAKARRKYRPVRVSRIVLQRDLGYASKFDRSPEFLRGLMDYGEAEARRFLEQRRPAPVPTP
jgi:hypothetical protein